MRKTTSRFRVASAGSSSLLRLALVFLLLATSGCSHVSYLWQAGLGQLALYNHERPLAEVIDDPRTPEKTRERLKWIPEIKKLVEDELGVKATSNYTTFVQLDRPFVIWSLTAAEDWELKLVHWSFPFFGAFPYLGFFKEQTARDWAKDYADKGYDTYIRGVSAYSTLSYLRDPMLSSMLSRDKADMVNLIFHESTHGQIYLKSQVAFNEQIASYIGDAGERKWLAATYGEKSKELAAWENDRADRRRFGEILRDFAEKLKSFYKENPLGKSAEADAEKHRGKAACFGMLKRMLEQEKWRGRGFARAADRINNNAALLAFLTYEDEQPLFDLLNEKCGGRPKDALRYLKSFEKDWSARLSSAKPGATPQEALKGRLLDTAGNVCLYPDVR